MGVCILKIEVGGVVELVKELEWCVSECVGGSRLSDVVVGVVLILERRRTGYGVRCWVFE